VLANDKYTDKSKFMNKNAKRSTKLAAIVQKTAGITGFTTDYIYLVVRGDHKNQDVMQTYLFLHEGENKLLMAARKLLEEA